MHVNSKVSAPWILAAGFAVALKTKRPGPERLRDAPKREHPRFIHGEPVVHFLEACGIRTPSTRRTNARALGVFRLRVKPRVPSASGHVFMLGQPGSRFNMDSESSPAIDSGLPKQTRQEIAEQPLVTLILPQDDVSSSQGMPSPCPDIQAKTKEKAASHAASSAKTFLYHKLIVIAALLILGVGAWKWQQQKMLDTWYSDQPIVNVHAMDPGILPGFSPFR